MNPVESKPRDLEIIKGWLAIARENNNKLAIQIIENLFPEVPEVLDLRIKEAVLKMVHDTPSGELEDNYSVRKEEVIDWLEKQGEQKSAWNEEDEKMFDKLYEILYRYGYSSHPEIDLSSNEAINLIHWLKSIKPNHM